MDLCCPYYSYNSCSPNDLGNKNSPTLALSAGLWGLKQLLLGGKTI